MYLPGAYGSRSFALPTSKHRGRPRRKLRAKPGTVRYLVAAYREAPCFAISPGRHAATRRGASTGFATPSEKLHLLQCNPRHVEALMAKKAGPAAANRLRKDLGQLFRFAAKRFGYTGQNPPRWRIPTRKARRDFTLGQMTRLRHSRQVPDRNKGPVALEIFLGTGAARQDAAALTRRNIRGGRLFYRRGKTGQEVDLPILPELARELAPLASRSDDVARTRSPTEVLQRAPPGSLVSGKVQGSRLTECTSHGLRKAGARRLAEAGATEWEVMAFLAHRTAQEASRYTAAANRAKLTSSGMAKLGADHEQVLSNLSEGLDKRGT